MNSRLSPEVWCTVLCALKRITQKLWCQALFSYDRKDVRKSKLNLRGLNPVNEARLKFKSWVVAALISCTSCKLAAFTCPSYKLFLARTKRTPGDSAQFHQPLTSLSVRKVELGNDIWTNSWKTCFNLADCRHWPVGGSRMSATSSSFRISMRTRTVFSASVSFKGHKVLACRRTSARILRRLFKGAETV